MATVQDYRHGWACMDCSVELSYGENAPDWPWVRRIDERSSNTAHATLGRLFGEAGCEHDSVTKEHVEQCEQDDYSSAPCDHCGSILPGVRLAITLWQ